MKKSGKLRKLKTRENMKFPHINIYRTQNHVLIRKTINKTECMCKFEIYTSKQTIKSQFVSKTPKIDLSYFYLELMKDQS